MGDPYLVTVATALALAVVTRVARGGWQAVAEHRPAAVAYLRRGARATVVTALAELHLRRAVVAARQGTVRRDGSLPRGADPAERIVFGALHGSMSPRSLVQRPPVRRMLAGLRGDLVSSGALLPAWRWVVLRLLLLAAIALAALRLGQGGPVPPLACAIAVAVVLWLVPRRTFAGRRTLRALRARHPPGGRDVGMLVALYGKPALLASMPRFAEQGGLLGGGASDDSPGGGSGGQNFAAGGHETP
ncbi:TIGR04222 domain-containing membrane protein [Amycolatopsis minnesotensis]|uniref:TIGR04222 domain-containing membrane protein n=1 Tax=Amycolatopsis minnesotensis TaxID=337894 RepID=A0ABP5BJ12_9PSEU